MYHQDGGPPHFARSTRLIVHNKSGVDRRCYSTVIMFIRSLNTPLHFFPSVFVKVLSTPPTMKNNIKKRMQDACTSVTPYKLINVEENMKKRELTNACKSMDNISIISYNICYIYYKLYEIILVLIFMVFS